MRWKLRRRCVFRAWQRLCKKDNSAQLRFPFPSVDAVNTPFSFTRRNVLRPAYGPFNLQNRWCRLASSLEVPMASTPPRTSSLNTDFHDDLSNFSSLGRSTTADIAWRSLLDLPLQSKRNPMPAFVNMHRYRDSRQLLRFKGCAKS